MRLIRKIQKAKELSLPLYEWAWIMVLVLASGVIKLIVKGVPFQLIAPRLGTAMVQDVTELSSDQNAFLKRVSFWFDVMESLEPWTRNCLNHAILGKLLLKAKGIPSTLHLGVGRMRYKDDIISAHAWLTVSNTIVCGDLKDGDLLTRYQFLTCFMS